MRRVLAGYTIAVLVTAGVVFATSGEQHAQRRIFEHYGLTGMFDPDATLDTNRVVVWLPQPGLNGARFGLSAGSREL